MWDHDNRKTWDVGEETIINLTDKPLSSVMRAIIQCDGTVLSTFSLEKTHSSHELRFKPRYCSVVMRISLPVGSEKIFEEISGHTLSEPEQVHLN